MTHYDTFTDLQILSAHHCLGNTSCKSLIWTYTDFILNNNLNHNSNMRKNNPSWTRPSDHFFHNCIYILWNNKLLNSKFYTLTLLLLKSEFFAKISSKKATFHPKKFLKWQSIFFGKKWGAYDHTNSSAMGIQTLTANVWKCPCLIGSTGSNVRIQTSAGLIDKIPMFEWSQQVTLTLL